MKSFKSYKLKQNVLLPIDQKWFFTKSTSELHPYFFHLKKKIDSNDGKAYKFSFLKRNRWIYEKNWWNLSQFKGSKTIGR